MKTVAVAGLAALLLVGCAGKGTRQGVAQEMIIPAAAQRTELEHNQQFVMAVAIAQPMPAWPQGVASPVAELPVCVEFVVSKDGAVRAPRLLDGVPDCAAADQRGIAPFADAALAAVAQWQFFAAGMCTWQQEEAECVDGRAEVTPLAIRLSYRFRFSAGTAVAVDRL